jgi:hypothetical protein
MTTSLLSPLLWRLGTATLAGAAVLPLLMAAAAHAWGGRAGFLRRRTIWGQAVFCATAVLRTTRVLRAATILRAAAVLSATCILRALNCSGGTLPTRTEWGWISQNGSKPRLVFAEYGLH